MVLTVTLDIQILDNSTPTDLEERIREALSRSSNFADNNILTGIEVERPNY